MALYEARPYKGTWMGNAGTQHTIRTLRTVGTCERVVIMDWADGPVEARRVVGEYEHVTILDDWRDFPSLEDAKAWAVAVLNA